MKKFNTSLILATAMCAATLSFTAPANATSNSQRFESTLSAPTSAVQINITFSEDLAYRAENLSKKLSDRSRSRGLNNGFAARSFYGQKDLDRLAERMERKATEKFAKAGIEVSDDAPTVLNITIVDAEPNRPTFRQLSKNPSQSFQSFGLGGASFEATMTSGSEELGVANYAWYETDIRDARFGGTWSDANRAIDRFARKTAKALKTN